MENRIYRYVNLGLLIRKENTQDGEIRRYLDQLCFYAREDHENRIYMLVEDGELVSEEIPKDILLKLERAGIQEPFFCESFTDTGRRADSGRIEKDTDKREKREKADQKRKPCGEKSVAFKSGKPCKRGLYIRISFSWKRIYLSLVHVLPEWE